MKDIQQIVVAIDFSEYSRQILEYAAGIAKRTSAEIIAVNVVNSHMVESVEKAFNDEHHGGFSREKFVGDEISKRTTNMTELIAACVPEQVSSKIVIRVGVPFEEIITVLQEQSADLLVIAPQGKTNFPGHLFGTTSDKLFNHSPVSILRVGKRKE
jgi:nucleotide-binding universal stress UspA family protein